MKRTVFYKTHGSNKKQPFLCKLANKPHRPKVKVRMVTPAGLPPIPYKEIDKLMYETKEDTFEKLAEETAKKIVSRIESQGQKGEIRVTVKVREDRGFWVEAVEEKTLM
jgi:hypothetical protein